MEQLYASGLLRRFRVLGVVRVVVQRTRQIAAWLRIPLQ